MQIDLLAFLRTGRFGNIGLGTKRAHVEAMLGRPDFEAKATPRSEVPAIWKYGPWELHFVVSRTPATASEDPVSLIYADDISKPLARVGSSSSAQPWELAWDGRLAILKDSLTRAGLKFTERKREDDGAVVLQVESGVELVCHKNDAGTATVLRAIAQRRAPR